MVENETILQALRQVIDPEIGLDIVTLGLVYGIEGLEEGDVKVAMTMTSPGCPMTGIILGGAQDAVAQVPGVHSVTVDLVWEPAWTPERIEEHGRKVLGG